MAPGTRHYRPCGLPPLPGWSPDRDMRVATALRLRIGRIGEEIDELLQSRNRLTAALADVDARGRWGRA